MDSGWYQSNTASKYFDSMMIVMWQETEEDIELSSWSHESSHGIAASKLWEIT